MTYNQANRLTDSDRIIIKKNRNSKIFPASIAFLFPMFFILIYFGVNQNIGTMFIILTFVALLASIVAYKYITRKHSIDLKEGVAILELSKIQKKVKKQVFEPGSASLGSPFNYFLNRIFPWFRYENKKLNIYYIVIDDIRFDLSEEDYSKIEFQEKIIVRRAKNSKVFLGVEPNLN